MEDAFRKFWSLKEAYTKGRGDGLGFEFKRCDFALAPATEPGASEQPVQKASVVVDGQRMPQWGFYIQALEADHWISVARGPPADMIDALGGFRRTFAELRLGESAHAAELERREQLFETKRVVDLVGDEMRAMYGSLCS